MVAIEMRFLGGRYHATPWDHQVNEGVVEWPPSPWRLLRALIATWYMKARDEVDEATMRSLIEKLAAPPSFYLPPAVAAHTRHFMPLYRSSFDRKTAKVFDTFVRMDPEIPLVVDLKGVVLTAQERCALETLLSRLGYLGRAESWVAARLVESSSVVPNSVPLVDGNQVGDDSDTLQLLAPVSPEAYTAWRSAEEVAGSGAKSRDAPGVDAPAKAPLKRKARSEAAEIPRDLFDALQLDTGMLKRMGWSQPPGSLWLKYSRPKDVFSKVVSGEAKAIRNAPPQRFAVFRIVSSAPPRLTDAVSVAERMHVSLVKWSDGSSVFTGCDENGRPLDGNSHAYILPESRLSSGSGVRGEVTHVTVFAPVGFGPRERTALEELRRVWGHGGNDIQLVLLGVGDREDFAGVSFKAEGRSPMSSSRIWVSRTPFVPTRHPKYTRAGVPKLDASGRHMGSPEHDLRRLLLCSGFPEPSEVAPVQSTNLAGRQTRWIEFTRARSSGGGRRASNLGFGFRVVFPAEVSGPIALGYGAHFGLGQFEPVD